MQFQAAFPSLASLGFDSFFRLAFSVHTDPDLVPARVTTEHKGLLVLATERGEANAEISSSLRRAAADRADLPAVGDWVAARMLDGASRASVVAVLPRRTQFVRRAAGRREEAQIVAANVDVVLLLVPLGAEVNARRLERTLAIALASGASPVVVLTKSDLDTDLPARLAEASAVAAGAPVHAVSCVTGEGVDALRTYFEGGRTVALIGPSGAGKSTLVNLLLGAAAQEVSALAADGRGRHTTTNRALFPVPGGGVVLDTPGMRELRVWDVDDSLDDAFDDVARLAAACRFGDCRHDREPGCAVLAALAAGELDIARFQSYAKLRREAESHALRADARTANEAKRRIKLLSRAMRASPKGRMSRE